MDILLEPRKIFPLDGVESRIREPDCVDHPALEFGNTWRGRAFAGLGTHRFRDDPSERIEIHHAGELATVSRRACREKNGILKFQGCRADPKELRGWRQRPPDPMRAS
jgi:hypothetical protein